MRNVRVLSGLVALTLFLAGAGVVRATDEPLPTNPALVRGALDNGLTYLIRKHGNPPGRVSIWLHVASGSFNETDATRGLAHYLEHMAFNGSANFPPGSLIPFFQSLGMAFGRDQNAFTGFEQTTYQLALPDTKPETIDKGLLYLSDVAMRLSLIPDEIQNERQIILEEKRTRAGAQQRAQEYIYERLAPESTFGRRFPIGAEESIKAVAPKDFQEYYSHWYVPSNMTLIVVGDLDPDLITGLIHRHFAAGPKVPRPADRDVGVKPQTTTRAIVATDPELTRAELSISRVEPARAPTTTVEQYRRNLIESIGTWVFNRRIGAELATGKVSFLNAGASIRQQGRAIRIIEAEASGRPGEWKRMLAELGVNLQRARLHGFSEREARDARTLLIAEAEEAVQREATLPARAILSQINGAVARRELVLSAAQRLDLLIRLLPGITAQEVSRAFAANFAATNVTFIAKLPSGGDLPDETELISLGRQALNVKPEKQIEVARVASLLEKLPKVGKIVELAEHKASGVLSAWLGNGVRAHYRFMDQRKNEATIVITLAGGQIQETAANRGITEAAALAWSRPATGKLSSVQIRDLMIGKKVRVSGRSGQDTMTLTVSGSPADLEIGLQLAHILLTDPMIEPAALEQWRESEAQSIAARKSQPSGLLAEALAAAFYPHDEPRVKPLEAEQVQKIRLDAAQAWLRKLITESPIEVVAVGDIPRPAALALVEKYLGSLPARDRISDKTLGNLRAIARPVGPIKVERKISTKTPQAVVMDGFFGTDVQNVRDVRLLTLAARILSTRMNRVIREEKQLVYGIGASSQPASEYPGFGLFVSRAPTDPAKAETLAAALDEMLAAFADKGPTENELAVAKKQIANLLDQTMKEPDFWVSRLSTLDYRGLGVEDIIEAPAAYQRYTTQEIRETFARYSEPGSRFRFVITPIVD